MCSQPFLTKVKKKILQDEISPDVLSALPYKGKKKKIWKMKYLLMCSQPSLTKVKKKKNLEDENIS